MEEHLCFQVCAHLGLREQLRVEAGADLPGPGDVGVMCTSLMIQ